MVRHASLETPGQRTYRHPGTDGARSGRVRSRERGVIIYDFEGDLFFGAAPDFQRFLDHGVGEAERREIRHIVLRLERIGKPDVVALEILDVFLKNARRQGLTILLAKIRPARTWPSSKSEFSTAIRRVRFQGRRNGLLFYLECDQARI
jgi:MFS superfamily sulfate permease-like transporter